MKILIAEDHELYSDGLQLMLDELEERVEIITASDFPSALASATHYPDIQLMLLDIGLPGTRCLEGVKTMREEFPLLPIVVISALEMDANVRNVMDLGVNGFISKSTPKSALLRALKEVLQGEVVVVADLKDEVINLSKRQLETLSLMVEGLSNKQIANNLGLAETTVRDYVSDIFKQLQVDNRVQAVVAAKRLGIIMD